MNWLLGGAVVGGAALAARSVLRATKGRPAMRLTDLFKKQPHPGTFDEKMNKSEAALILNVSQNAKKKDIMASYKKLMVLNHPDQGGSEYMASKVNEAKDFMVNKNRNQTQ